MTQLREPRRRLGSGSDAVRHERVRSVSLLFSLSTTRTASATVWLISQAGKQSHRAQRITAALVVVFRGVAAVVCGVGVPWVGTASVAMPALRLLGPSSRRSRFAWTDRTTRARIGAISAYSRA